jgi:hypothetical protein
MAGVSAARDGSAAALRSGSAVASGGGAVAEVKTRARDEPSSDFAGDKCVPSAGASSSPGRSKSDSTLEGLGRSPLEHLTMLSSFPGGRFKDRVEAPRPSAVRPGLDWQPSGRSVRPRSVVRARHVQPLSRAPGRMLLRASARRKSSLIPAFPLNIESSTSISIERSASLTGGARRLDRGGDTGAVGLVMTRGRRYQVRRYRACQVVRRRLPQRHVELKLRTVVV